ncbi:hypothetical protein HII31_09930 [Pseudocercospora fuligena]|uniref:Uncharacterized protein n=1 Tax=Pseudocercospora fuligena TaxID=685502 RepID=A0A8H6RCW7_9PEZI|nr:hypothetical protein HII31_09930 [Pseudocercospora fuligena]
MPRPSLERTLKYIPVVPRAHSKLGREARRGSHDLRKLVGHANFLDTLMDQLDLDSVEEQPQAENQAEDVAEAAKESTVRWNNVDFGNDSEWETEHSSSSEVSDDEELVTPEYDGEDDEEHALGRTASHTRGATGATVVHTIPITTSGNEHSTSVSIATRELDDDDMLEEAREAQKGAFLSTIELSEDVEDYFADKNIQSERAQVTAALSTFDVGTTAQAVGGGV